MTHGPDSAEGLVPGAKGRLRGSTAIITGAGRGLGRGVAIAMAMEGARLWVCDQTVEELDKTVSLIEAAGGRVEHRRFDLSSHEACEEFARDVIANTDRVDCLVNNAGVLPRTPFAEVSRQEWDSTLAVNLTATFVLCQRVLPRMEAHGGSLINMSSRAGVAGFAKQTSYCASKFAVEGFTRALATELPEGVSANTVTPGMRIKPTNLTEAEERALSTEEREWRDPIHIAPAFIYLSMARGRPNGFRFDAQRLTETIRRHGYTMPAETAESIAE